MLRIRVKAPFAAFHPLVAGSFRPSAPFITFSAAYGLLMNISGIETRYDDGRSPMTLTKSGLPSIEIAIGSVTQPQRQILYQQLHNYPVGDHRKKNAKRCRGTKYNIQMIRREFLSNIDGYICIKGNKEIEERVWKGLKNESKVEGEIMLRYGIPFLGDNSYMIDVLQIEEKPPQPARWYQKIESKLESYLKSQCKMTIWIDRANMHKTISQIFELTEESFFDPPDRAWVKIVPPDGKESE